MSEHKSIYKQEDNTFVVFGEGRIVTGNTTQDQHQLVWMGDTMKNHTIGNAAGKIDWDKEVRENCVLVFDNIASIDVVMDTLKIARDKLEARDKGCQK